MHDSSTAQHIHRHHQLLPRFYFSVEHQNLQQRLEKKERECEAKSKEKEDMMEMLNKMKDKLQREVNEHKHAKQRVSDLSAQLQQLTSVCVRVCEQHM